jgi:membrane-bound ClpP family serine protease
MIALSIVLFFFMFWCFPLQWKTSMMLYALGSGLMFTAICVFFEDYGWASRMVDVITKPFVHGNIKKAR